MPSDRRQTSKGEAEQPSARFCDQRTGSRLAALCGPRFAQSAAELGAAGLAQKYTRPSPAEEVNMHGCEFIQVQPARATVNTAELLYVPSRYPSYSKSYTIHCYQLHTHFHTKLPPNHHTTRYTISYNSISTGSYADRYAGSYTSRYTGSYAYYTLTWNRYQRSNLLLHPALMSGMRSVLMQQRTII